MRIICFLYFLFFVNISSFSQSTVFFKSLETEIDSFVTKVKPMSIKNGQYNVYVVIAKHISVNEELLSIGYVCDESSFIDIQSKPYCISDGEYIFFDIPKDQIEQYTNYFRLNHLNQKDVPLVRGKLFQTRRGGITGRFKGMLIRNNLGKMTKEFYNDSEEMPEEMQILKWPKGSTIEHYKAPTQ